MPKMPYTEFSPDVVQQPQYIGTLPSISWQAFAIFSAQWAAVKQCFPQGPGLQDNPSRTNSKASSLVGSMGDTFFLTFDCMDQ